MPVDIYESPGKIIGSAIGFYENSCGYIVATKTKALLIAEIEDTNGKIYKKNCCIRATRHIHANKKDMPNHNNKEIVEVKLPDGTILPNVHIKMKDSYNLEMHIDRTDATKYNLDNGDYVDLE